LQEKSRIFEIFMAGCLVMSRETGSLPFERCFRLKVGAILCLQAVQKIAENLVFAAPIVFVIRFAKKSTQLVFTHRQGCQLQNIQYIFVLEV
jgi:hypothetical protein